MNANPLFSILIANYNDGQYIEEAIKSVSAQTYNNWEIIIVDDFSTDESRSIYQKYHSDCRVKIFYNNKNYGRGYTKRKCIKFAQGEICGFLDADDMLVENAISIMISLHQERPKCSLIYSTHYNFNGKKNIVGITEANGKMEEGTDFAVTSKKIISHFVSFKQESYKNTDGIDITINNSGDVDLYLKLEEVGEIFFINQPLYLYRIDNSRSVCHSINKAKYRYVASKVLLNAFYRRIKGRSILFLTKKELYWTAQKYWITIFFQNREKHLSKELLNHCLKYVESRSFSLRSIKDILKLYFRHKRQTKIPINLEI